MRIALVGVLSALAVTLVGRSASAGCDDGCTIELQLPVVTPELACITVEAGKREACGCAIALDVSNGCEKPLEAQGFVFDWCGRSLAADDYKEQCPTVEVGRKASVGMDLSGKGTYQLDRSIVVDGEAYTVSVQAEVVSFRSSADEGDSSCALVDSGRSSWGPVWVAVLLVVGGATRRARRTPPRGGASATY